VNLSCKARSVSIQAESEVEVHVKIGKINNKYTVNRKKHRNVFWYTAYKTWPDRLW